MSSVANQRTALRFAVAFFNPQQIFLLRDKLITQSEKRDTSIQNLQQCCARNKSRASYLVFRHLYDSIVIAVCQDSKVFLARRKIEDFTLQEALWIIRARLQGNNAPKHTFLFYSHFRAEFHAREETFTVNRATPFLHLLAFLTRLIKAFTLILLI